jgi:hypothetical protein
MRRDPDQSDLPHFQRQIDISLEMASARIKLDPQAVEAIARRVVERLQGKATAASSELVDAAELARRLGVDRSWVYTHAIKLGAIKLGGGRRLRLRFDPKLAAQRIGANAAEHRTEKPSQPRHLPRPRTSGDKETPGLLPIRGGGAS